MIRATATTEQGSADQPIARAAFFDLDKTLIPGSSLFLMARGAYDRDLVRVRDMLRFAWAQFAFRLRGEHLRGMDMSRRATLEFVSGRTQQELVEMGREIAEERILPRVYENIVKVIEGHKQRGDLTFLVTAAPVELAQVVSDALGMTGTVATVSEVDERGHYTGRVVGAVIHGLEKAKAVADMAARHRIDLIECAAYSDSINDLPLLESVGDPHAVNPDHELQRIARHRGWPVHELRTRRRTLLVGIPAGVGGAALFSSGLAAGLYLERRRQASKGSAVLRRLYEPLSRHLPLLR